MNQTQQMNQNQAQQMNQMHHAINFNHALSVRSDVSIGQSLLKVGQIIEEARRHGYESVALVDDMTVSKLVEFTHHARQAAIKPLTGCRLRVVDDPTYRKPPRASGGAEVPNPMAMIKVYVMNQTGMASLMKLLNKAHSRDYFHVHSRVGWDEVMALDGVVVTTGDVDNLFQHPRHDAILARLQARFGPDRLFVELVPVDTPLFDTLNVKAITAARRWGIPTLASTPFMLRHDDDAASLAVMQSIVHRASRKSSSAAEAAALTPACGFNEPSVLVTRIAQAADRLIACHGVAAPTLWDESIRNRATLVRLCQYEFQPLPMSLPVMVPNEFALLGQKCIAGWQRRCANPVLGSAPTEAQYGLYRERMLHELAVLKQRGLIGYFLMVEDLVSWAKGSGMLVGPGRGSVGGSLVAFLIGITEVDPIRFQLPFERFIHPARQDVPDVDLDFMASRRNEVIDYLTRRHGADRVAGINHFTALAPALALRETARAQGLDSQTLAHLRHLPKVAGQPVSLQEAAEVADVAPQWARFRRTHATIWQHAITLEGVIRAAGTHPVGIVVAGEPLVHRAVLEMRAASGGAKVVNWDKRNLAQWGLVKLDILGLSALDVLAQARKIIEQRHGVSVDYLTLPLMDSEVMAGFARGDTTGVFQFESPGMKQLLRDLATGGPLTFDDIAVAMALYRPGPINAGVLQEFVQIRQGLKPAQIDHPKMAAALERTHGVIVYQEQVMQLAVDVAGFSQVDADRLRLAMSQKDQRTMEAMRAPWRSGCLATAAMTALSADTLFDKLAAFVGYGFNRAHAISYAVISVWTMWLRVRYPAEFFAACLSQVDDDAKRAQLVSAAHECGIAVLPPDINRSTSDIEILDGARLLMPFQQLDGITLSMAQQLVALRERHGSNVPGARSTPTQRCFDSMNHFRDAMATTGKQFSRKVVEHLRRCGALAPLTQGSVMVTRQPERVTNVSRPAMRQKIHQIVADYRACRLCNLQHRAHPAVRATSTVRFMVVCDCPSWEEEQAGHLLAGQVGEVIKTALGQAALSQDDGYFTTLVKGKKADKSLSQTQIDGCATFLNRELALIRPPIIVALGKDAIRRFVPDLTGSTTRMEGQIRYDARLGATIVCGANPQQIYYTPAKMATLVATFAKVAELLAASVAAPCTPL